MADALAHRGPDDAGDVALRDAAGRAAGHLAHRRLAVLDPTPGGHQPMASPDGTLAIAYNGEIYNFRQLRAELQARGATFAGQSDTEVLLAGWRAEGPAFLDRLRGMFAFVLWDARAGRAVLARDRFGIKPLYVAARTGLVAVASEVGALLRADAAPRRLSRAGIDSYLATGSAAEPAAIVDGVRVLSPGCWLAVDMTPDGPVLGVEQRFATVPVRRAGPLETDPARAGAAIRAALRGAVAAHLVSDVEVGLFLSGGADSAAILALATELAERPLRTFTVGFGEQGYDEAGAGAEVARRFGAPHAAVRLSEADALAHLDGALAAMDQPSMDGLNVFFVSRAVRACGVKVALSGLGGDELFAGYPSFARAERAASLWSHPAGRAVRHVAAAVARRSASSRGEKAALWLSGRTAAAGAYTGSRALFGPRALAALGAGAPAPLVPAPGGLARGGEVSWYELTGYMRNTLLRDADVFSMACGLELRVPFVDSEVAAAVAGIDDALASAAGTNGPGKPLLRLALGDLLPPSVGRRPKQGFTLPLAPWMRGALRRLMEEELRGEGPERCGLPRAAVWRIWRRFLAGHVGWSRPWALYALSRWARERDMAPPARPDVQA